MTIPFYQVDAFTGQLFGGNPAAVCPLTTWPSDDFMQRIAAENNLSETAFLVPMAKGRYALRWFTPEVEVDLCGHATLASAFVLFSFIDPTLISVDFETASGLLTVTRSGDRLAMDFPARPPVPIATPEILAEALGAWPLEVLTSRDLVAVFPDEEAVRTMAPDFALLRQLGDVLGIIVTARGDTVDFVSRFFAPNVGVNEDPVTGSAHSTLIPYWSRRLQKSQLHALQLSKRGGELFCENMGERVCIAGQAVLYARGELYI